MVTRPLATLVIEDSETDGCINVHFKFEPQLIEESQAHHMMARVIENLQVLIQQQSKENLSCALKLASSQSATPAT